MHIYIDKTRYIEYLMPYILNPCPALVTKPPALSQARPTSFQPGITLRWLGPVASRASGSGVSGGGSGLGLVRSFDCFSAKLFRIFGALQNLEVSKTCKKWQDSCWTCLGRTKQQTKMQGELAVARKHV